jgi:hypothetical protein
MELEQVLERLRKTIDLSKTLKEEQFNYSRLVSYFNENKCGTVCCIAGHYPNWNIEGFYYHFYEEYNDLILKHKRLEANIRLALIEYHGLSKDLIDVLFYGENFEGTFTDEFREVESIRDYSLKEVIERFETVYELLENKTITPDWDKYE